MGRNIQWPGGSLAPPCRLLPSLCAPREGNGDVTRTAEQPIVLQSALAAPVRDGDNVIGFPSWTRGAPCAARDAICYRRFRTGPLPMCLNHVEAADLTNALVPFLDLLTNVPRTTSNLPLVNARITAEGAPRGLDDTVTPPTNRFAGSVTLRLSPLICGNDTRATSAHARSYRPKRAGSLAGDG